MEFWGRAPHVKAKLLLRGSFLLVLTITIMVESAILLKKICTEYPCTEIDIIRSHEVHEMSLFWRAIGIVVKRSIKVWLENELVQVSISSTPQDETLKSSLGNNLSSSYVCHKEKKEPVNEPV